MSKSRLLALALLMLALPLRADDRRRSVSLVPDTVPPALSPAVVPVQDDSPAGGAEVGEYVPEPAAPEEERTAVAVPQDSPTVWQGDPGTWQGRLRQGLAALCNAPMFDTSQLGLYVYDITAGEELFAKGHRQRMRPASCEKLVTAVVALDCLGGDYRLLTDLRATGTVSGGVLSGDVYVVGRMDPLLSSADVRAMAHELRAQGIERVAGTLYIDTSFLNGDEYGWGWCWDDKWGPLCALTVDGSPDFAPRLLSALASAGVRVDNASAASRVCPQSARLLCQSGHGIEEVLQRMMKNSDNIFAESLFYHLAAYGGGRGVGRARAVERISALVSSRLGLDPSAYQFADGSGLSLYNYVSPQLLVSLLSYAWRNEDIRSRLLPSLPVSGTDGTLARRMADTAVRGKVRAKTGTVDGISSLSGYATSAEGHILAFSIINQGITSARQGHDFQDRVCRLLCR